MEAEENNSIAKYLAEIYGYRIDLLPNPDNEESADTFNHTLGYEQAYKLNSKPAKGAIDNALRKAARQANNIVLRIDSEITLEDLRNGLCGRINQCPNVKNVTSIIHNLDETYTREQILTQGFQIKQEDFK